MTDLSEISRAVATTWQVPPAPAALPPVPATPVRDHPAFFDTECFPNYWLLKIRPQGGTVLTFRLRAGECFTPATVAYITMLFDTYCCIGFYSKGYDQWTISRALCYGNPGDMKLVNDQLIVDRIKGWNLGLGRWEPRNHIDIMEVAPGAGSQKQYAGRIHAKTMRDLPYEPGTYLNEAQIANVDAYCDNDLDVLEHLFNECAPLLELRVTLTDRYGIDLRSKSDAQVAEAVLKARCEQALGRRIYKPDHVDTSPLRYRVPAFISYTTPELQHALNIVRNSTFFIGEAGNVLTPEAMEKMVINLGRASYKIGIGGLHSQEKCVSYRSDDTVLLRDIDVASYYPSLILNSGEFPPALGRAFRDEYQAIKDERLAAKATQQALEKAGDTSSDEHRIAKTMNEGGKIMINGTFGKTGSIYSILFAPSMLIQTTLTGQLSLLMLIEWHELYGIPVVSANTDGMVTACPRHLIETSKFLIAEWERRTGLVMETTEYRSIHSRDVNNYFAVKMDGKVKRKGEYAKASLVDKKNPDLEICSDAVAAFLSTGRDMEFAISTCRDIRKFVTIQKVDGGGIKMWGEAPMGDERVKDMLPRLAAHGWQKGKGAKWFEPCGAAEGISAKEAFDRTFPEPRPEYLGKVVRWYYGTRAPGHIVYATRKAKVSLSYGAQPCMTLPDTLPGDIDYPWYFRKARAIIEDIGWRP